ncbi:MAG TPA: hypothetical protein VM939_02525 [Gemmatimonadaceae bacterium]|nr:hypothetical protein [Gemmatimonadaceae bacterium]
MTERRFDDAEVAAIFERATEEQQTTHPQLRAGQGLTLGELQEIGREVGISPERLARAAKSMDVSGQPAMQEFLGLPVGVGLTVDLDRKLTDAEWDRFVVDLRETFDARGKLSHEGSFRQWSNGNLQALLEPAGTVHRIRLRTVKGDARGMIVGGMAMVGFATVAMIAATLRGALDDAGFIASLAVLATGGSTMFGLAALRLPGWARLRKKQMEDVAERVVVNAGSR